MRTWCLVWVALVACGGDDDAPSEDAGSGSDATIVVDADAPADAGSGTDAGVMDGGGTDAGSTGEGVAPRITRVVWTHGTPCSNRDRAVTVTTTVEDPDTPASALVYSGEVFGCTGSLDAATATVICRGTSPTIAHVGVTDEGARMDEVGVNIEYCVDGEATF